MNILVICTNNILFEKSGANHRLEKILSLMNHKKIYIMPKNNKELSNSYYFTFLTIFGKGLVIFTDINISYISVLRHVIKMNNIDVIHISYPWGVIAATIFGGKIPVIYDSYGVESDFSEISVRNLQPLIRRLICIYIYIIELLACKRCAHIITISEIDKLRFIEKYNINPNKITTLQTPIDAEINLPDSKIKIKNDLELDLNKKIILFHGSLPHEPNKEAIDLICQHIAPEFTHERDVLFIIAGNNVPKFKKENIISLGFIEDIDSLLSIADIAIVPIISGSGVRMKIIDYLKFGLPIVTTKKGIEGIAAKNREHAIIVDNIGNDFINAIKYLLDNERDQKYIAANARKLARQEHDWDKINEKLNYLYENILNNKVK